MNPIDLDGIYLAADISVATAWHHNHLRGARTQTIYGIASKDDTGNYNLDWETKGPLILGLIGGLDQKVVQRMDKEGKM